MESDKPFAITVPILDDPGLEEAQLLFATANSFQEAARRCADPIVTATGPVTLTAPAIACYAFSVELYLKALICDEGQARPRSHDLLALFNRLSDETQEFIRHALADLLAQERAVLEDLLALLANAFVDWRYIHEFEEVTVIPYDALVFIAKRLFGILEGRHPEWKVNPLIAARVAEPPVERVPFIMAQGGGRVVRALFVPSPPVADNGAD